MESENVDLMVWIRNKMKEMLKVRTDADEPWIDGIEKCAMEITDHVEGLD